MRAALTVLALWAAGLGAAAQFGKISVLYESLGAAYADYAGVGIGCDQLLLLEKSDKADVRMRIFNADGGEISTCGNASRCVADVIMNESGADKASIETSAGIVTGTRDARGAKRAANISARWINRASRSAETSVSIVVG